MNRNRIAPADFLVMLAGLAILTGAYTFALHRIDSERAPAVSCTTDSECAMTPDCLADPTCDGGPA